jgi:hypothetical protein
VIDGDDVRHGTTGQNGWQESPQIRDWRPPGEAAMNRLMNQQDALDRAARAKELAEAARNLKALREAEQELNNSEPKDAEK